MNMKVISVIHDEFKTIAGSYAILLVLMGGIFVYGLLYNYMYAPDLVRKVPVAVVDHSHSELSRHYVRLLDATPQVNVVTTATGYPEAQDMMKSGRVAGILYLPDDFEDRVARGEESVFIMYETTSAFLYYLAMQEASAASMLALNDDYRPEMLVFLPKEATAKLASAQAVEVVGTALYNPTEGYGAGCDRQDICLWYVVCGFRFVPIRVDPLDVRPPRYRQPAICHYADDSFLVGD